MDAKDLKWVAQMNKKIAWLTKTVYRLHSESVDRKDDIVDLETRLQEDLQMAGTKAKELIDDTRHDVERSRESIDATVRAAYDQEFVKVKKEFDEAKERLEAQRERIVDDASKRMHSLKAEFLELQKKAQAQRELFNSAKSAIEKLSSETMGKVGAKHEREMKKHADETDKKRQDLIKSATEKAAAMKTKFEAERDARRKAAADTEKSSAEKAAKKKKELETELRTIEAATLEIATSAGELKAQLLRYQKDAEEYMMRVSQGAKLTGSSHSVELKRLQDELVVKQKEHEQTLVRMKKEGEEEEKRHRKMMNELRECIVNEKAEHDKQMQTLKGAATGTGNEQEESKAQLLKQHQAEIMAMGAKHAELMEMMVVREKELQTTLEERRKGRQDEIERHEEAVAEEIRKYKEVMDELERSRNEELEALRKSHSEIISRLRGDLGDPSLTPAESMDRLITQIASLKEEIEAFKYKCEVELKEKDDAREAALVQMKAQHDAMMSERNRAHVEKMAGIDADTDAKIKKMKADHEKRMREMEMAAEEKFERDTTDLRRKLEARKRMGLQELQNARQAELDALKAEIEKRRAGSVAAQKAIDDEKARSEELMKDTTDRISALESEWKREKAVIDNEWGEKLELLKEQHMRMEKMDEDARRAKNDEFQAVITSLKKEIATEEQRRMETITMLRASIMRQRTVNAENVKRAEGELQELRAKRSSVIDDLQRQIIKLKEDTENRLNDLEAERQQEIGKLEARLKEMIDKGEHELNELRKDYEAAKLAHGRDYEALRRKIDAERIEAEREVADVNGKYDAEIAELESKHQGALGELTDELERLKEEAQRRNDEHQNILNQQQSEHDQHITVLQMEYEEKKREIDAERAELDNAKRRAIAEIEAEIRDWEQKVQNGDARPEDIEKIRHMEAMIAERSDAIDKVHYELKHYQTELMSRETTYNKVFNNKPQVGVLSALERKAKRDAMIASMSMTPTLPPLPGPVRKTPGDGT